MTVKDQLKALEMTEYQHLLQTVHAFGFNYDLKAKVEVLFTDIESVLKIDYVLSCLLKFRGECSSAAPCLATLEL